MNAIDKLLKADIDKLTEKPTAKIEIKRLSKVCGEPFIMTVTALDGRLLAELAEDNTDIKGGKVKHADNYNMALDLIVNGTVDPDFKNADLMRKFGAHTPNDVVAKLFLPAEMGKVAEKITDLCGVENQSDVDELVKN